MIILVLGLVAIWAAPAQAGTTGPRNLGFEGSLAPWIPTPVPPAVGSPVVVGTEGPGQFPIYLDMGVVAVSPWGGQTMLRLGAPKGNDSNQLKSVASVSQTFVSDGQDVVVAYRLLTYEHRSQDNFDILVKKADGSPAFQFRAPVNIAKTPKYWDSGWSEVRITGLPAGQLTLSYTLSNTENAAHDTWIYVDHRNIAPSAGSVAITPAGPTTDQTVTAIPSGFGDAESDPLTYHYAWSVNGALLAGETGATLDLAKAGNGDKGDTIKVAVYATDGNGGQSATVQATTVVADTAPVAGTVAITPAAPTTGQTLTATPAGFSDADGAADIDHYTYVWSNGGVKIAGETGATLDLAKAGNGDKGDTISVSVKAVDKSGAESGEAGASVTVANTAPVADFTWAPGGPGGEAPHEGDAVGLYSDPSFDPDGDAIVRWQWRVEKPGQTPEVYRQASPIGFIVPYDEGDYSVTLTVWDADSLAGDGSSVTKVITVQNDDPRVNALNVEVLPGGSATLVGRFLDTGWTDLHSAVWTPASFGTEAGDARVDEDHLAAVSSGYVDGTVTGGDDLGSSQWSLSVGDSGGEGTDTFDVTVIDPDPTRFESEETYPDFHVLESDGAYLSYIQSEGDIDIFEVKTPGGGLLPQGTEVLATLRDLPADYDLVVFEGVSGGATRNGVQAAPFMHSPFLAAPFMHSPFMHSPFMHSPFMHSPFMHSPFMHSPFMHSPIMQAPFMHSPFMHSAYEDAPFMHSPFMHSPFMHSPFMHSPFMHSPFMHSPAPASWNSLDGYPLSAMSFTGTANDNTSGIDIAFNELGFDNEAIQNLRMLGFSANTGTESDVVLATAGYPQTAQGVQGHVYVAVKGAPGNFAAAAPYTLQIETSSPLDPLAEGQVVQPELVADPSEVTTVVSTPSGEPLTLFVTQLERLSSLYPAGTTPDDPRDGGQIVSDALQAVADRADVKGVVISLPAKSYEAWDREPWKVDVASALARELRDEVQAQLTAHPSIRYVVLVGNDRIVPSMRLPDKTIIGNEQSYSDQSFLVPPSATLSSIANGYILTDDVYVDETPISWSGSYLYVPDRAVSRLVEKPAEIAGSVQAFIDADGVLERDTAVVSGHSFMEDGASAVGLTLTNAGLTTDSLFGEDWHGADLWAALQLGPDLTSLNSHFTHFAGLSAFGYGESVAGQTFDESELLLSRDIAAAAAAGGGDLFRSKLVISMGCHSGLNVSDEQAVATSPSDPIVPALDLPQAMMRQGGVYLGSTGYGYGDTVGIAGTEALVGVFADQLVSTAPAAGSVGLALAHAKQAYLGSLSTLTPYEQKSSVEFTLYGMPQYRLPTDGDAPAALAASGAAAAATSVATAAGAVPLAPFVLTLGERSMQTAWTSPAVDRSYPLVLQQTPSGDYITADGRSEANADRPIHPVIAVGLANPSPQGPAHGFVYKAGTYADLSPDGTFEPVISRFTNEWEVDPAEFQVATAGFWPAEPGVLTTIETAAGYSQTFVAVPAQFKPASTTPEVVGHERVWSSLRAEVLRAAATSGGAEDWLPPSVLGYDLWTEGGKVTVSVDAHDASGISRIVVLQMGATGMSTPAGGDHEFGNPGTPNGADGRYDVTFDPAGVDPAQLSLLIQVVDGSGNVTTLTGKGDAIRLPSGLRNPGFEQGMKYWGVSEPVAGNAGAVGAHPISSIPGLTVDPFVGEKVLQLGGQKDGNSHQIKGVTSVSQQFISVGGDIVVAYRLISFDSRVQDVFVVDVKDSSGVSVGAWSGGTPTSSGDIPYKVSMELAAGASYIDSGWAQVTLSGLPAGKTFTISYTLNNDKDAAHDTWIYVDQGR